MKLKMFFSGIILVLVMAADAAGTDITGKWVAEVQHGPLEKLPITFNFTANGNVLTGTTDQGVGKISDGKIEEDNISFSVLIPGPSYAEFEIKHLYRGKVSSGDEIRFTREMRIFTPDGKDEPVNPGNSWPYELTVKKVQLHDNEALIKESDEDKREKQAMAVALAGGSGGVLSLRQPMTVPKQTITSSGGLTRSYYVYVPDSVTAPVPLILLLPGNGASGMSQIEVWKSLAEEKNVILVAPDSFYTQPPLPEEEVTEFLHNVLDTVKAAWPVDERRMYLFGHSAGAIVALYMAIAESRYFAAAAAHAGILPDDFDHYMPHVPRKIPVAIWVGDKDPYPYLSLENVRNTRDKFEKNGFPIQLTEIPGHDHNYYRIADTLNKTIWEFLSTSSLADVPVKSSTPTP